jgi:GNAT superfamily N-acetyltransferase
LYGFKGEFLHLSFWQFMSISIRLADLDSDRQVLIELMLRYLTRRSNEKKFDWLYRDNPDGKGRVWIAVDKIRDEIVGSGAAIPRRMFVGDAEQFGCVLADFWIHPQYRSLGPAVQLQRACLEDVRLGRFSLCYDFPQSSMGAVYKRLGITPQEILLRLTRPLLVDQKIEKIITTPLLTPALSALGNLWLRHRDRKFRANGNCTISVHTGDFGEEFSSLARRANAGYGVCVQRSAEYLNWRYRNHYFHRYEVLTARLNRVLMAYVVFVDSGEDTQIVDLFGLNEPDIVSDLIGALVSRLREFGKRAVNVPWLASHPWVELFRRLGFYVRESFPIVTYPLTPNSSSQKPARIQDWFLTYGDIDP